MNKYALLLACLTWTLGTSSYAQTAGGGAGASGATGGAATATGATGTAVGGGASGVVAPPTTTPPTVAPGLGRTPPGLQTPRPGVRPGQVNPPRTDTGAIGGVGAGTGAIGGLDPATAAAQDGLTPSTTAGSTGPNGITGTTADVQTGINGVRPGTTTGTPVLPANGVTVPGAGLNQTVTGTPTDIALSQRIRTELMSGSVGAGRANPNTALTRGQGVGILTPDALSNVQISANGGTVTLQGTVASEAQRRLLENRIRRMSGVRTVVDNLTLAPARAQGSGTPGVGHLDNSAVGVGNSGGTATGTGTGTSGTVTTPVR